MYIVGISLVILGFFVIFSGIIGLFRLPDFYTKLHASGIIDSCGVPVALVGLMFLQNSYVFIFKLIIILFLMLLLNPVSTHVLSKASLTNKE